MLHSWCSHDTFFGLNCRVFVSGVILLAGKSSPIIPNCATETTVVKTNINTGEVIYETTYRGSRSGSGWIMMFTELGMEVVTKCPSPAALRIFLYLSLGQTYNGGMATTKRAIEEKLGISHMTCSRAFEWLKKNFIVHEWRNNGITEFMINPRYVSVGKFDERIKLWNDRWNFKPFYSSSTYQRKKSQEYEELQSANGGR